MAEEACAWFTAHLPFVYLLLDVLAYVFIDSLHLYSLRGKLFVAILLGSCNFVQLSLQLSDLISCFVLLLHQYLVHH